MRAFCLSLLLASMLPAAEVVGKWYGTMTPDSGPSIPVLVTLHEEHQDLSGSIVFAAGGTPVSLEKLFLSGDQLTFQALDNMNHVVTFELTVTLREMHGSAFSEGKNPQRSSDAGGSAIHL